MWVRSLINSTKLTINDIVLSHIDYDFYFGTPPGKKSQKFNHKGKGFNENASTDYDQTQETDFPTNSNNVDDL